VATSYVLSAMIKRCGISFKLEKSGMLDPSATQSFSSLSPWIDPHDRPSKAYVRNSPARDARPGPDRGLDLSTLHWILCAKSMYPPPGGTTSAEQDT
jgi:hypothetical protein